MHEYSIVGALIEQVAAQAEQRRATHVSRLCVRIGELSGVDTGLLQTAYETFRPHTVCDGAELEVETVPARWACPACGTDLESGGWLRCDACGRPARLRQGDEIVLATIEMEVRDV